MDLFKRIMLACILLLPISGCAFGTDYVHLDRYTPQAPAERPGEGVTVYVAKAVDSRENSYIGEKRNGFGMHTGNVAIEEGESLTSIITGSVSDCLSAYGYIVKGAEDVGQPGAAGRPARVLSTSIDELWVWPVAGFWTVDAASKMRLVFTLKDQGSEQVLWSKEVFGSDKASSAFGVTTGLYEESLGKTVSAVMKDFQGAISSAKFKVALEGQAGGGAVTETGSGKAPEAAKAAEAPAQPPAQPQAAPVAGSGMPAQPAAGTETAKPALGPETVGSAPQQPAAGTVPDSPAATGAPAEPADTGAGSRVIIETPTPPPAQ